MPAQPQVRASSVRRFFLKNDIAINLGGSYGLSALRFNVAAVITYLVKHAGNLLASLIIIFSICFCGPPNARTWRLIITLSH